MKGFIRKIRRYREVARFLIGIAERENGRLKALERFPQATLFSGACADDNSSLGERVVLHSDVTLVNTVVGRFTYFAAGATAMNSRIGSFCSIGPDVKIGHGKHPAAVFASTYPAFFAAENGGCQASFVPNQRFQEFETIEIGNDVWIGARVLVTDGVSIGDGAIVAAGAVVTKDVAPYSIVGGVPAKHIRYRFTTEEIDALLALQWWYRDIEWLRNNACHFDDVAKLLALSDLPHTGMKSGVRRSLAACEKK